MRVLWRGVQQQVRRRVEQLRTPKEYVIEHGTFGDTPPGFALAGMPYTKQFVTTGHLVFIERSLRTLVDLHQLGDPAEFTTRATFFLDPTTHTASRFVLCDIYYQGRHLEELGHLALLEDIPTYEVRENPPRPDGTRDAQLILHQKPLLQRLSDRLQRRHPVPMDPFAPDVPSG